MKRINKHKIEKTEAAIEWTMITRDGTFRSE